MSKNLGQTDSKLSTKHSDTKKICIICATHQKFKKKKILKEHITTLHDERRDVIKSGKSTRYMSKDRIQNQGSKRVGCTMCEQTFTSQQNQEEHKELDHALKALFKGNICSKIF